MKFNDFRQNLNKYPVFSQKDLAVIMPNENFDTLNNQLSSWTEKGWLSRLKNGTYLLSSDFLPFDVQPVFLAAKLYGPSYVSLEYALSFYGIIPEAVFNITSVTTKLTRRFDTPFGIYSYRHIKPEYFFGFKARNINGLVYYFAEKEKAVLDYLYLNSARLSPESDTWKRLRFQHLDRLNFKRMISYARRLKSKKLLKLVKNLKDYAKSN